METQEERDKRQAKDEAALMQCIEIIGGLSVEARVRVIACIRRFYVGED